MVFSSIPFLVFFLPLCLLLYTAVPGSWKNPVLLVFSLIFYAWGEPVYILLMLFSCALNWFLCRKMEKRTSRRALLIAAVIVNLAMLVFFKYANLLIETFGAVTGLPVSLLSVGLPVGISFYTFQAMSCVVDVYRREVPAEKSLIRFMTYISMFPQLIAGPIVRYADIADALDGNLRTDFTAGTLRFSQGLFKKVLLANTLGLVWDSVGALGTTVSVGTAWLGIAAYTLQIYFDFSGYSDMAIGMGLMLGFRFPENFNFPYISRSITEFWRRWHITLSSWFKSYVYIPLGGNRVSKWKNIRNLLIVWGLSGLWHGASWNFLLWGLYYGVLLALEKFVYGKWLERRPAILRHLYTMFLVVVGFAIFVFDDFSQLGGFFRILFFASGNPVADTGLLYLLRSFGILFAAGILFSTPVCSAVDTALSASRLEPVYAVVRMAVYVALFVLSIACLVGDTFNPFLYFRF
ncbi:MAG: MBOAT family O-acyltransferase [Clostridiaceae bacterium]|nr:MBOAT family O-acyltransferase [Clostridiaceae bacterium]